MQKDGNFGSKRKLGVTALKTNRWSAEKGLDPGTCFLVFAGLTEQCPSLSFIIEG